MTNYQKGANFERDIVKEFWVRGWAAVRSAGSGSVGHPVPDIIGVRYSQIIAIECKTTRKDRLYLKKAILNLSKFAEISNARSYLAVKFPKKKPMFFDIKALIKENHYTITINDTHINLDSLLGEQSIL